MVSPQLPVLFPTEVRNSYAYFSRFHLAQPELPTPYQLLDLAIREIYQANDPKV